MKGWLVVLVWTILCTAVAFALPRACMLGVH